jgi:hypothetical protein
MARPRPTIRKVSVMSLHCAATLLLVRPDAAADVDEAGLAAAYGPWVEGIDVMGELQHLADQHRGERVLVTLVDDQFARVLQRLTPAAAPGGERGRVRLQVGDDGWALVPWDAG